MELTEAQTRITELEAELAEAKKTEAEATERADRAEGAIAVLEARKMATELLTNVSLPAAAKSRIIEKVTADPKMTDGKIDADALKEAVEAAQKIEADYIEAITSTGKVTDQGTQSTPAPDDKKIKESLGSGLGKFFGMSDEAAKRAADAR